jgi:competence protein ComEC
VGVVTRLPLALWRMAFQERERWPLWLPVFLATGIGIYFALPFEPARLLVVCVALACVGCVVAYRHVANPALRALFAALAALAFGFASAKARTEWVAAPVLQHRIGPVVLEGRVEAAELHGKNVRVTLGAIRALVFDDTNRPARVRISIRSMTVLPRPGSWLRVRAILMPPPAPAAPGAYDFGRTAYYLRLGAVGFAYGHAWPTAPLSRPGLRERVALLVKQLRTRMTARIHQVLPGSTGGVASALITGDRAAISDNDEQALRDAGLAHVLAIAGLHMALVGLGLFWVVRAVLAAFPAIALRHPIKKWSALAALCSASFYLLISGATSASTRAFIMLAAMLIAVLADRPALSMRALGLAACVILIIGPESLLEPGFQMSFAAVVGLIAVAEWEASRPTDDEGRGSGVWRSVRNYLRGIVVTSLVGSVATIPYAVFHFDRATHYAVLGNLLAMPVMGFVVMPAAALAVFLMPFGLDAAPLRIMGSGIEVMLSIGRWVSDLPGAVSVLAAWPPGALVLISFGGLWIGLWRRRWRWIGVVPVAAGLAYAWSARPPDLLIARDGMTAAIRAPDGRLVFLQPPEDKFSAAEWLKGDGDARAVIAAIGTEADGIVCDARACMGQSRGLLIADVIAGRPSAADCAAAIVISASQCAGRALVIDRLQAMRTGGEAVWLDSFKPPVVETVQGERGVRAWSLTPEDDQ